MGFVPWGKIKMKYPKRNRALIEEVTLRLEAELK